MIEQKHAAVPHRPRTIPNIDAKGREYRFPKMVTARLATVAVDGPAAKDVNPYMVGCKVHRSDTTTKEHIDAVIDRNHVAVEITKSVAESANVLKQICF